MATKSASAVSLKTFSYSGKDKKGKMIRGVIKGTDIALVKAQLRQQGIAKPNVRKKSNLLGSGEKKIIPADVAIFSRQMATMMSAGVPLVMSFDIVGKGHDNPTMANLIMNIKATVEGGTSFAEALEKHPEQFNELYVNLVAAGEQAGILDNLLDKLALYLEKTESLKKKIKSAMFYPAAILVVAFVVTMILLLFVIPQFESLFENFGGELPAPTQFVVSLSKFVQARWYVIFGGLAGIIFVFRYFKKNSQPFNDYLDGLFLKLPVIGEILTKGTIARFARTLSTMFAAGVPLVEAMESVAKAAGNVVFYRGIMNIRDEISTGTNLQTAMANTGLFGNMVVQMVAIGEESGSVDSMLAKVADFYEEEVDNLVDGLTSMLEPLIMAFLGVVIGGLVVAMYLPIFKMGSVV